MSAPQEILEELRDHIRRRRDAGDPRFAGRRAVGEHLKCFLDDLDGGPCSDEECRYDRKQPTKVEAEETYPLDPEPTAL